MPDHVLLFTMTLDGTFWKHVGCVHCVQFDTWQSGTRGLSSWETEKVSAKRLTSPENIVWVVGNVSMTYMQIVHRRHRSRISTNPARDLAENSTLGKFWELD